MSQNGQGSIDRAVGLLFGLARGAFLVSLAYLVVSWVVPPSDQPIWLREARMAPLVREGALALDAIIPPEIARESRLAASRAEDRLRGDAQEKLLERLNSPSVTPRAAPAAPEAGVGYSDQQRRQMERLGRGAQ